jgi:tetratricopeptide (TPR) repeat protein
MPRPARTKPTSTAGTSDPRPLSYSSRGYDAPSSRWLDDPRLWSALIVVVTCLAFSPLFTSDFTNIDDPGTVARNPKLNPPTLASLLDFWDPRKPQMDLYVPVTYTVWSAVARLAWLPTPDAAGIHLNSWMFHGTNVILHALSALVVFQILRMLLDCARLSNAAPVGSAPRTDSSTAGDAPAARLAAPLPERGALESCRTKDGPRLRGPVGSAPRTDSPTAGDDPNPRLAAPLAGRGALESCRTKDGPRLIGPVGPALRTDSAAVRSADPTGTAPWLHATPVAAAGALLFALHPVQAEPVGWASGTKDVLYGLLSLIALWGYLRSVSTASSNEPPTVERPSHRPATPGRPGPGPPVLHYSESAPSSPFRSPWYWLATLAFILAMLSKPTAIVTPLVATTLDVLVLRRRLRDVVRAIWPWFLLVIPIIIEARLAQPAHHPGDYAVPLHLRPLIATDALAFYLYKLLWPAKLAFIYNRSPQAVISHGWLWWTWIFPAAAAISVLLPLVRRNTRRAANATLPLAALAIFVICVLPVLGLVPFDFQQFSTTADHYLYLAMLGPALGAAFALDGCARVRRHAEAWRPGGRAANHGSDPRRIFPVTIVCITLLAALGVRTFLQTWYWHDSFSLLEHAIAVNPESPYLYDNLSKAYADDNLPDAARRWDEESVRRWPDRAASHLDLASDLLALNRPAEAEAQFEAALRLDPACEPARQQLADLRRQGATSQPTP